MNTSIASDLADSTAKCLSREFHQGILLAAIYPPAHSFFYRSMLTTLSKQSTVECEPSTGTLMIRWRKWLQPPTYEVDSK